MPAGGTGQTVAIVDAFDDPNAESDLSTYRAQYGLPACTTANGCFRKVDQRGGTSYPEPDHGWSTEISLDLSQPVEIVATARGADCRPDCMRRCGDGVLDAGEVCDDRNDQAGDGCFGCRPEL